VGHCAGHRHAHAKLPAAAQARQLARYPYKKGRGGRCSLPRRRGEMCPAPQTAEIEKLKRPRSRRPPKVAQLSMCGSSCNTTLSKELWISRWPL
jgi:hypothetical protein